MWPTFLHLYTWELNFGQTIWDISEVLLGTFWWTTWELGESFGNFMAWQHPQKKKKKERTRPLIRSHLEVAGSDNTATCHHNSPHWERPSITHVWQRKTSKQAITRSASHCGLAIYIKKYLKAKEEELWKLKYFIMQKYSLQKNPLKETKILQNIITLL